MYSLLVTVLLMSHLQPLYNRDEESDPESAGISGRALMKAEEGAGIFPVA